MLDIHIYLYVNYTLIKLKVKQMLFPFKGVVTLKLMVHYFF